MWGAGPGVVVGAESTVLTPETVATVRSVTEIAMSPDGRQIAYLLSQPRKPGVDEDGEPWSELWVLDARTGTQRPFITGKVSVEKLDWTPDGRQVGFLAKRGDDKFKSLYFIPIDGGEARLAVSLKSDIRAYSFSPDGGRVALLAGEPEDDSVKKLKEKGFKQEIFEEDWRYGRVWVAKPFEPLATNQTALPVTGSVRQVRWSPVEDRLALSVTPTPSVDDGLMRQRVVVVDAGSGAETGAVDHAGKLEALEWSPDGRQLAMVAGEDLHDPSAGRLMVVSSAGGKPRDLTAGWLSDAAAFSWRDATRLWVVVAQGVLTSIQEIDATGRQAPKVLSGPGHPVVTGLSLAAASDGLAVVGSAPGHPSEIFTREADGQLRRRTDSNPWLAGVRLARQEVVRHRARDGVELEGILIRPLEEVAGAKTPLILSVHGGPESHVSDGWLTSYSLPGQVASARGFAVFYPNYRGSTGRGVAFSKLGQGDAAGKEFDDLVDAVDHLVGQGWVDRANVGVTGGSYGGYATAWCSTKFSERFAAGVMFVGISDKISKVGTTDIPDEEFLVHARKRPWEDWQFLLERSPIFHAGQSRTPLLILHGADDPRVHPGQSKELYRHLKLRSQAPVRLVLYPGEGHGNRKAGARYDYHLRMLQWFEKYLLGPGGEMPSRTLEYDAVKSAN
jgi:dipeptidyl aminopeptidase/acylaminoacyl peptidase